MHNHMNSATLYRTTDSCEILSEHGTSLLKIPLLLYHNTCVGFAEARPIDIETSSLVIGESRSEPHTSDVNQDFPFVYIYVYIYLPSVIPYIPVFYFNDM